jgi:replicative DNA helicase
VVDYIQIVRVREVLLKQRHELAIGEVSTELKALAKELDIAVVAVAQLNRGVESRPDKRPGLNDLRDSGQLEQDADIVTFLYRDEYYNPETSEPGIVEVIVEKQRNGPTGTLKMKFDGPTTRFENLPDDGEDGRYA